MHKLAFLDGYLEKTAKPMDQTLKFMIRQADRLKELGKPNRRGYSRSHLSDSLQDMVTRIKKFNPRQTALNLSPSPLRKNIMNKAKAGVSSVSDEIVDVKEDRDALAHWLMTLRNSKHTPKGRMGSINFRNGRFQSLKRNDEAVDAYNALKVEKKGLW